MNPKVSIIIPVYNGSNYLREAIDSTLAQTYENIEIIVVNDGSIDDGATQKIATSYGSKIRYFEKDNGGVSSALNLGIEKMTGKYFSWLSHDDMYEKRKIEDQVNLLNELDSEDVIIACNVKVLFQNGIRKKEKIDARTFKFIDIFLSTSANIGLHGCSLLIPKAAFEACGTFDTNLSVTQDYSLWFKMKDKYKFVLLDKPLVITRRHHEQDSVKKQKYLFKAADELHANFLRTIPYDRFKIYFEDKKNIKHTYDNYKIYVSRGLKTTASIILGNILRYYHETDKENFYRVFVSEINLVDGLDGALTQRSNKLTVHDRNVIDREYAAILGSDMSNLPMKEIVTAKNTHRKRTKVRQFIDRLTQSIKRDGVYLTSEKIFRKLYRMVRKITDN